MESWISEAIKQWTSSETKMNPPASIEEIEQTELVLNFKFPDDFKQLYQAVNGFQEYDWQQHMFSFWSLSRIIEEFKASPDTLFIGFCDFLIASSFIGFLRNQTGIFKSYDYIESKKISETYQDVVHMINSSIDDVY